GFVAELEIGFDGVAALVLEFVGAELGHEADAAAFLLLIEKDSGTGLGDGGEGELELLAAVAAEGMEGIAGEALGGHPDAGWGGRSEWRPWRGRLRLRRAGLEQGRHRCRALV